LRAAQAGYHRGVLRLNIVGIVYLVVGFVVASNRDYFATLHTLKQFASAALAVVLWPLLFVGINLHVH
jgi:hypothetical protein